MARSRKNARGTGAWDRFKNSLIKIRQALGAAAPAGRFPRSISDRSKYKPHQGAQEIERRRRQIAEGKLVSNGKA